MSLILPDKYPLPDGHPLSVRTPRAASPSFGAVTENSSAKIIPAPPPVTTDADTLLRIVDSNTFLHARPMEFFLANSTDRNQINLAVTFDANVYSRAIAEEFIEECRQATLFYLGGDGKPKPKL